jgi:hypothetical protein
MILKLAPKDIVFGEYVQNFCRNTYGNYRLGCPNYGKKKGCPPCELIDEILDFSKPIYLIYSEFNVGEFASKMRNRHSGWTEKQAYNSRLWQGRARKEHNLEIKKFLGEHPGASVVLQPERKGVDVNLIFTRLGIKLEWPPRQIARVVSLAGEKRFK